MSLKIILLPVLLLLTITGFAQKVRETRGGANSLHPYAEEQPVQTKKKPSRKKVFEPTYNAERDYYKRVEAVAKARRKNAKLAEKPQYSNPLYFGHKRPPKKRPPGKMKFCQECGIRH
ncbi:MAG TPA: hypothetical protein VD884_12725 [Ohtaekwangia sp.]|nr:hypothetical protein [Ohtaekwangia sp.]